MATTNGRRRGQKRQGSAQAGLWHLDALTFLKSQEAESVDLIVTDPAYSSMNQHLKFGNRRIAGTYAERGNGGDWFDEFEDNAGNYGELLKEFPRVLRGDRHIFIMFDSFSMLKLGPTVQRELVGVKNLLVWDKVNLGMGHKFRRQTEFIVFACKGERPLTRRDIPDIWPIKRLHRAPYPTQKPVEVLEAMIASSVREGERDDFVVCDPFVGSGSSALAALRQSAQFVGSDVSEEAISIAEDRISHFEQSVGEDSLQPRPAGVGKIKPFWEETRVVRPPCAQQRDIVKSSVPPSSGGAPLLHQTIDELAALEHADQEP